jgi:alkylhydroperoxidase family enzyme
MGVFLLYIAVVTVAAGIDHFLLHRPARAGRRVVTEAEQLTRAAARALLAADNRITVAQYEMTALYEPPGTWPGADPP